MLLEITRHGAAAAWRSGIAFLAVEHNGSDARYRPVRNLANQDDGLFESLADEWELTAELVTYHVSVHAKPYTLIVKLPEYVYLANGDETDIKQIHVWGDGPALKYQRERLAEQFGIGEPDDLMVLAVYAGHVEDLRLCPNGANSDE